MLSSEKNLKWNVYAGWNKSKAVRDSCASGGIFYSLAKTVVTHGGVAIGAAFCDEFQVRHVIVDDVDDLDALKQSKYVLSNMGGLFPKIKEMAEKGQNILFSGTPCQVSALKRYLGKEYENVIYCSFFCYGAPLPSVYNAYLNNLKKSMGSNIASINFKDKRYG